jgi:XK-related protein
VLALSLFASAYTWFVWPVCLGHWVLMATWLWLQKTAACSTRTEEFFFCLLLAVIHVFTFFNVKPDRTAYRYTFYYLVSYLTNYEVVGMSKLVRNELAWSFHLMWKLTDFQFSSTGLFDGKHRPDCFVVLVRRKQQVVVLPGSGGTGGVFCYQHDPADCLLHLPASEQAAIYQHRHLHKRYCLPERRESSFGSQWRIADKKSIAGTIGSIG